MSSVNENKPKYWRSLAELEDRPEFREFVEREFAEPLEHLPPNSPERRHFMQIMGASLALAGLAGCRWDEDKVLPYTRRPEGLVPGETREFATTMEHGEVGVGLRITSYDNRPIKADGNPDHPGSFGGSDTFHQASTLSLYDPDRSRGVSRGAGGKREASSWEAFDQALADALTAAKGDGGAKLCIMAEPSSSPTLAYVRKKFGAEFPQARWVDYAPVNSDNEREGSNLAFGAAFRTHYDFSKARVVLTLDGDIVGRHANALPITRSLMAGRDPDGEMNRVYAVESSYSLIGGVADHRLAVRAGDVLALAAYLDAELSQRLNTGALGAAQPKPAAEFLTRGKAPAFLAALVEDLAANTGKSVIVAGSHQPPAVHAIVHRLNALLGNVGQTIDYTEEVDPQRPLISKQLAALVTAMKGGSVDTLVIIGVNPVYDAPADLAFADALAKVKTTVHVGTHLDETGKACAWHAPLAHYLEVWGDSLAYDGTLSLQQPLIAPLFGARSAIEVVAVLGGDKPDGLELVKRTHAAKLGDARKWRRAVHDGFVAGTAAERKKPSMRALTPYPLPAAGRLELVFLSDYTRFDGRYANNAWLTELPDPITKVTWDNVALFAPSTAKELGFHEDGTLVKLTSGGRTITIPAVISPGQAEGSVLVTLGWGRTDAGLVAGQLEASVDSVGVNVYPLRTSAAPDFTGDLAVQVTGEPYLLAGVQDRWAIDQIGRDGTAERLPELVREANLDEYKKEKDFARHKVHSRPLLSLWVSPVSYEGHKWGMTIDLNKCTGCSACIVACQAENNIPVVGKKAIERGREMYWLRIDRYFKGDPEAPEVVFQPVTCHHCENAPCEQVCPVGATMHSHEGLNDMVYNRCIGTRYCSNNCPYKVRKFNYFNFRLDLQEPANETRKMVFNPDVTLRSRGVMEKCTFCVQRIQRAKIKSKNAKRAIVDGEIRTACQQTCVTGAIQFGDLNDGGAQVRAAQDHPRSYAMLGELNNRPRLQYQARVRNPNEKLLAPASAEKPEHG